MKWVVGGISLFIFCGSFSFSANAQELSAIELEMARDTAIHILHTARGNDTTNRALYTSMAKSLRGAAIKVPARGSDFSDCREKVLAFVHGAHEPYQIFLCNNSLEGTLDELAQTLIHEAAHLAGWSKECDASRVELQVMRLAGAPLAYENSYLSGCGLR